MHTRSNHYHMSMSDSLMPISIPLVSNVVLSQLDNTLTFSDFVACPTQPIYCVKTLSDTLSEKIRLGTETSDFQRT